MFVAKGLNAGNPSVSLELINEPWVMVWGVYVLFALVILLFILPLVYYGYYTWCKCCGCHKVPIAKKDESDVEEEFGESKKAVGDDGGAQVADEETAQGRADVDTSDDDEGGAKAGCCRSCDCGCVRGVVTSCSWCAGKCVNFNMARKAIVHMANLALDWYYLTSIPVYVPGIRVALAVF